MARSSQTPDCAVPARPRWKRWLLAAVTGSLLGSSAGAGLVPVLASSGQQAGPGTTIAANLDPSSSQLVDTGLDVTQGQQLFGGATGQAQYGLDVCHGTTVEEVTTDPDGFRTDSTGAQCDNSTKIDPSAVDGSEPVGALIGRIGRAPWFMLGTGGTIPTDTSGRLYLAFNDTPGGYGDNIGSYTAFLSVPLTVSGTAGGDGTVNSSNIANVAGVTTGLNVAQGETIGASANGSASYGYEEASGCSGQVFTDPAGSRSVGSVPCTPPQKIVTPTDNTIPVPDAPIGSLIGEIGTGPWFLIGGAGSFVADASGPLLLGYNDNYAADNAGSFTVTLVPGDYSTDTTGGTGGGNGGTTAVVGAPPVETDASWNFADSTGAHSLVIHGTGLSAVTTIIYGLVSSTSLPPACGEIQGVLAPTPGPCSYSVPVGEHVSDTELKPTAPPQADLRHITLLSPWGRTSTFSLPNPPVQPVLSGAAVNGLRDPGTPGASAYPTEIALFGSGLSDVSDVTFGQIPFPDLALACPQDSSGVLPAGEPCSYIVTAADHLDHGAGTADTYLELPVPVGADVSHISVFSPGGGSNTVSVANEPPAPVVTAAQAVFSGNGSGTMSIQGSNLSDVTTVLLGRPTADQMPEVCPYDAGGAATINDNLPCVERPDDAYVSNYDGAKAIKVAFPPGVKGPNDTSGNLAYVVLLSPHGKSNAFAPTLPPAPTLSSVAPDGTAPDGRPELLFTGTNLSETTSVDFGSHPSPSVRTISDTQVIAELASGTGSVQAQVNTLGGPSNTITITYPSFGTYSFSSSTAPTGNPYIDITGGGITNSSGNAPQVFFGNIPSPDVSVTASGLHAEVPNLPPGYPTSVYVVVRTTSGDTPDLLSCPGSAADCFAYPGPGSPHSWAGEFGPPRISGLNPTHLSPSSLTTTIAGSGFQGATSVQVGTTQLPACPSSGGCFKVLDDNQVSITAPPLGPGGYPLTVTNPAGTSSPLTLVFNAPPGATGASTVTPVSGPASSTGTATSASNLPGNGFQFGPFTATGTWSQNGSTYTATGTVTLNGFLIEPDSGVSISFDTQSLALTTTGQVTVSLAPVNVPGVGKVGPFVLYHREVSWTLSADTVISDLSNINIGGLPVQALSVKWPKVGSNSGSSGGAAGPGASALALTMKLPAILGGQPFTFNVGTTSIGVDPSTLHPCLGQVALGGLITVNGACLSYNSSQNSWFLSGNGQVGGDTQITGSMTFTNGAVSQGSIVARSTSLAGLIGVTGFEINYVGTGSSEEWQGQATDTGGHQSSFDFKFTGGSLTTGSVDVPQASIGGVVSISNLKFDYQNGNWSVTSDAAVNGVASASGSLAVSNGVVTSANISVTSPDLGALVSIPAFQLSYDGSQPGTNTWSAQVTDNSGHVDSLSFTTVNGVLTSGSLAIPQASITGVVSLSGVSLAYDTGHWHGQATASLPGGSGGSVLIDVTYDASGQLSAAHFEVYNASLAGALTFKDLKVDYASDSQTYGGTIDDLVLPGASLGVGGKVEFSHGAFQGASVTVNGNIPLGGLPPVLFLRQGTASVSVNPLVVSGGVTVAMGPQVNGVDLLSGDATLTYAAANGSTPSDWHLALDLEVLDRFDLAKADVDLRNGNELSFGVGLQLPPPGYNWPVSGNGVLSGWVTPSGFSAYMQTTVNILNWKPTATILVNNQALQACGDTGVGVKVGFRYTWSGQFSTFFPSCDITKPVRPFATEHLAHQLRANGELVYPSFTAASGDTVLAGSVAGQGGLPSFTLTDPNGQSVDIPSTTASGSILNLGSSKVFVLEDGPDGVTDFIVSTPVPGTYATTPDSGSIPLGAGTQYAVNPEPMVSGSVTSGRDGQTLSWSAANLNGDTIEFVQEGASATTQTITTTNQVSGTVTFDPSDGPGGTRTVTAVVTDPSGVPVLQSQIATFDAPTPTVPAAPGGLALGAGGSQLTWSAPSGDGGSPIMGYKVYAGQSLLALTAPGELSTDIGGVPAGTALTVVATNAVGDGLASAPLVATTGTGLSTLVGVSGTASSDPPGSVPGPGLPEVVTVVSPAGGPIQITKTSGGGVAPAGYIPLGVGATISAPQGSANKPLSLTFSVAASVVPAGVDPQEITVTRDGVVAPRCSPGSTQSDLCVQSVTVKDGVVTITVLSAHASAWQVVAATTDRIAGIDRVATAIAVSNQAFPSGGAGAVVIARSDDYADALAGGPLAAARRAPLLITPGSALDPRVLAEVRRVAPAGSTVYLLGGRGALSPSVSAAVQAAGYKVVRLAGPDRYGTAVAVADALGDPGTVLVAKGDSFPDALSASDAAVGRGAVLLSSGSTLPTATSGYLAAHRPSAVYAIGGPAAQALGSAATASLVGSDRYGTAVAVAQRFFPGAKAAGLASGTNFPDALAAAPMLGAAGEPLLLTDPANLPAEVKSYLASAGITQVHVFGGPAAVAFVPRISRHGSRAHGRSSRKTR